MHFSTTSRAIGATVLGLLAINVQAQSPVAAAPGAIQTLGCYKSADTLTQDNNDKFQSSGICQTACTKGGHSVMATIGGTTCYCGDELPALDQEVDPTKCSVKCAGYGTEMCGGIGFYQLYLTGTTGDVKIAPNSTDSSSSSSSSGTKAAETVVVTQPASSDESNGGNGPSKVGIAVGVVVGVVAVAGLIGGAIFFMRQKRKKEIEEDYKAQLAINSFVNANKSGESKSGTDSRLDQSVFSARRESVGSIADERDFSRRILQVSK